MSHKTLPYLTSLRKAIADIAKDSVDSGFGSQASLVEGLLDYMTVQRTAAHTLIAEQYAALDALLPRIESLLGRQPTPTGSNAAADVGNVNSVASGDKVSAALGELKSICATADSADFDRCLQLAGELESCLLAHGTPEAATLCKRLLRVEAEYCRGFEAAARALAAKAASDRKKGATARNAREYDEKALLAFIRESFPDEGSVTIEKSGFISGGMSKFTIGITLGNVKHLPREIVLRGDANATFGGASVADEYRVVKALYEHGVCVPKPLALETGGKIFGSAFLLAERKPGIVLGHAFHLPGPNPAVCIDVATQLSRAHQLPLAALGPDFGKAHPTSSAKALTWIEEGYANWKPLDLPSPAFTTAFEWLRRNVGISDRIPRGLVHGDFSMANILVHDNKVSAILDWEFAHAGNTAYDLGYHRYLAEALGSWESFLDAYARAGMPVPSEEQLNYNTLLADVRLGVMVCQVKHIFTSGAEANTATGSVLAQLSYETTIDRISATLDKVL